jgi:hypothetical protein
MRPLAVIVAIEAAVLVIAVGAVLHSERRVRFPTAIAAASAGRPSGRASVPVSISIRVPVGSTAVTADFVRGGRATAVVGRALLTP